MQDGEPIEGGIREAQEGREGDEVRGGGRDAADHGLRRGRRNGVRRPGVVPQDAAARRGLPGRPERQVAPVGAEEDVRPILAQQARQVRLQALGPAAIIVDREADRASAPGAEWDPAGRVGLRRPQTQPRHGLPPLERIASHQRERRTDRDLAHHLPAPPPPPAHLLQSAILNLQSAIP